MPSLKTCNETIYHRHRPQSHGRISRLNSVASLPILYVDSPCISFYHALLEPTYPGFHHCNSIMHAAVQTRPGQIEGLST